ncbi:Uncharacterised protein [Vibrio cholerae]|nr:Uncharacterised protein [Vibrio cholerae]
MKKRTLLSSHSIIISVISHSSSKQFRTKVPLMLEDAAINLGFVPQ